MSRKTRKLNLQTEYYTLLEGVIANDTYKRHTAKLLADKFYELLDEGY